MPILNLNNTHFTPKEQEKINALLAQLEEVIAPKAVNLSGGERQRYGSISEQNKLFVNKVLDYARTQPSLCSPDVDWDEFNNDASSRIFLETLIARIYNIAKGLDNAKTLHDYDNFQAALSDYAYTVYKAGTASPGFETKRKDLKQFFQRSKPQPETKEDNQTTETENR